MFSAAMNTHSKQQRERSNQPSSTRTAKRKRTRAKGDKGVRVRCAMCELGWAENQGKKQVFFFLSIPIDSDCRRRRHKQSMKKWSKVVNTVGSRGEKTTAIESSIPPQFNCRKRFCYLLHTTAHQIFSSWTNKYTHKHFHSLFFSLLISLSFT